ncbi:adenosylcobinamide-GDP ribazoletransferase [Alkalibacter mobilis]|uniref:adenosylcobinamide-GDP ribazoletransferase n=1 Tax=Alkalibacter mobilis TaxID=2787712 RepID=UPI0018A00788|nr:adenosylcobinamide-GDP ribazoletransferase [Alkalibacter mobilis]MBF7096873.1 adenosylcobinamide-GDP ribazoletransferase [Alkalibacter mobilis]
MKKLLVAVSFYTRIPINIKSEVSEDEFYDSMRLIPIVGLLIGAALYLLNLLLKNVDGDIRGLTLTFAYILISGGLHIDGFMDSMDGLLSNRDREKVFEIMKDSRVGAFGVLGIIVLFALLTTFLKYADPFIILIMPVAGRSGAIISASLTSYAKERLDLGGRFVQETKLKHAFISILFTVALALVFGIKYLIPVGFSIVFAFISTKWIERKIGGTTGDTIGMIIETTQAAFIISAYFLM